MEGNECIRIAQIIGKWVGGGVEMVVMNYYRFIDHKRFQFDFICDEDSTNIPYEEIEKLGGKVILIPPYQNALKYQKELQKVLTNYKIVHSHINTMSVFSLFAAKRSHVPIRIAHSHSTTNKSEGLRNLMKQVLRPLVKVYATDYFACTEHAGKWLFGNRKFYIMNNAFDLDKFEYDDKMREKIRKELNISEETVVIGHIGRFMKQKNHEFVVEVFKEYHKKNENSKLLLVGQGPLSDSIRQKVEDLALEKDVIFLGQRTDVSSLYQAMDLFIFPSLYEGLGLVVIEAQCSNLPCVASTEVPYAAKVTDNIEFLPLTAAIKKWVEVMEKKLVENSRKSRTLEIEKHGYNIKKEVKKLEAKYLEMCDGGKL